MSACKGRGRGGKGGGRERKEEGGEREEGGRGREGGEEGEREKRKVREKGGRRERKEREKSGKTGWIEEEGEGGGRGGDREGRNGGRRRWRGENKQQCAMNDKSAATWSGSPIGWLSGSLTIHVWLQHFFSSMTILINPVILPFTPRLRAL